MTLQIRAYQHDDEMQIVELWHECRLTVPHNDPLKDIRRKMAIQPNLFLVGVMDGRMVASIMAGYEGHRGWLNYLAISTANRRQGIGRKMVLEAERRLRSLGCPKINLQVRTSNAHALAFYHKIGFVEDSVVSLGKRLEDD